MKKIFIQDDQEIPKKIAIPGELIAWLEGALGSHDYGRFGIVFTIHQRKIRWSKINEESGEILEAHREE